MIDITGGKGYNGQKVPLCQKDINGSDTEIYHCGDDSGKVHLFSYRTQKLSLLAPKILNWRRFGKIGSCCIQKRNPTFWLGFFFWTALPSPLWEEVAVSIILYVTNKTFQPTTINFKLVATYCCRK